MKFKDIMQKQANKLKSIKFLSAFTLAEVLITLGIIGMIAEMTIPTLMNQTQDAQFKAGAKVAFSNASQAVELMKIDAGDTLATYAATTQSFKPLFMNYFKVAKDCSMSSCVPSSGASDMYTTLGGVKANTCYMDDGQFITADGMFYGIENYSVTGILMITVDVNGIEKKPNKFGKDFFTLQIVNDTLLPMGTTGTFFPSPTYCDKTDTGVFQGLGCMSNIMQGISY